MLFVVYRKIDNQAMMGTDCISCIPFDALDSQEEAGHYFKVNGKRMTAKQVRTFFKDNAQHSLKSTTVKSDSVSFKDLIGRVDKQTDQYYKVAEPQPSKRKVRKIRCIENGKVYNNMTACAKDLGMDPAAISYAMQKNKPAKGYSFEFVE